MRLLHRRGRMALLGMWAGACTERGDPRTFVDASSAIPKQCSETPTDDCAIDTRCQQIYGTRYDLALECKDEPVPLGCRDKSITCPDYYRTTVRDSEGKTWLVEGGSVQSECLPSAFAVEPELVGPYFEHWQSCSGPLAPPCAELSVAQCSTPRCVALAATRVDIDGMCTRGGSQVGCMANNTGCDAAETPAKDPSGHVWLFSDTCIPKGWTMTSIQHDGMAYRSLPPGWEKRCP